MRKFSDLKERIKYDSMEFKKFPGSGQKKLRAMTTLFLKLAAKDNMTLLYAGSAPGTNLLEVLDEFPKVNFILIDPREHDEKLKRQSTIVTQASDLREAEGRVIIYEGFMDDNIAEMFSNREDILFMSDIRTMIEGEENPPEMFIRQDMENQLIWMDILGNPPSFLKVRALYGAGYTEIPLTDLYLQPNARGSSSETRAYLPGGKYHTMFIGNREYEDKMYAFNIKRVSNNWDKKRELEIMQMKPVNKGLTYKQSADKRLSSEKLSKTSGKRSGKTSSKRSGKRSGKTSSKRSGKRSTEPSKPDEVSRLREMRKLARGKDRLLKREEAARSQKKQYLLDMEPKTRPSKRN